MKICAIEGCTEQDSFPFKCKRCGLYFCAKHRLPEQHNCKNIDFYATEEFKKTKISSFNRPKTTKEKNYRESEPIYSNLHHEREKEDYMNLNLHYLMKSPFFSIISFNNNDNNIITIGSFFASVMFLRLIFWNYLFGNSIFFFPKFILEMFILFFGVLFVYGGHEYVHHHSSKKQGIKTSNIIWKQGLFIYLLGIIFPPIIAPIYLIFDRYGGTVEQKGKITLNGIAWLTIWQMILILMLFSNLLDPYIGSFRILLFFISAFLVAHLLPFGLSDGQYILNWNKRIYWSLLIYSILAFFLSYIVFY